MIPGFVPIRIAELRYAEEFVTRLTGARGLVVDSGYVLWEDRGGRHTRVRAVLARYGTVERVHLAEMVVLVEAWRPHARFTRAQLAARWSEPLPDPDGLATVGEVAVARRA